MSIVNFSVPATLEKRIAETIREKGFPSKAELFRFVQITNHRETKMFPLDNNKKIASLSRQLDEELRKKVGSKQLPSLKKQMARIKYL